MSEEYLPVPTHARPRPLPERGYRLEQVASATHVVIAHGQQANFVETSEGILLIDTPPVLAPFIKDAIASVSSKPVTHVILSHAHWDHIAGTTQFADARFYAHQHTVELLGMNPWPGQPPVTDVFSGAALDFRVGDQEISLRYPGPNHCAGNIITYVPGQRVAAMADLFSPGWAPWLNWGNADYIPGILNSFDTALDLDFEVFLTGHLHRPGTREDTENSRQLWLDMWRWTRDELDRSPADLDSIEDDNSFGAAKKAYSRIADKVAPRIIEKWGGRLAGVDVWTPENVTAMAMTWVMDQPHFR